MEGANCLALGLVEDDVHGLQAHHGLVHAQRKRLVQLVGHLRLLYAQPCRAQDFP